MPLNVGVAVERLVVDVTLCIQVDAPLVIGIFRGSGVDILLIDRGEIHDLVGQWPIAFQRIANATLLRVVEAQRHVERIERCQQQLGADGKVVGVVGVLIGARETEVLLVAIAVLPEAAHTQSGEVFDDRHIQHAADHQLVVVADLEIAESLEVLAWWTRDDVHRATRGVAAVEGALGSAENLDAFDIEEGERRDQSRAVLIDAVDVDRRRLIGALGIRNTADRDLRLAPLLAEMHAWNEDLDILYLRDAGGIELRTHDGRRRSGHLLQCL